MATSARSLAAGLSVAAALSLSSLPLLAQAPSTTLEGRWLTGAREICALETEPWPGPTWMLPQASLTISGCRDIETPERPLMRLLVAVTNTHSDTIRFRLPLLSEVTARSSRHEVSAYALYFPPRSAFATAIEVGIETQMAPGKAIQLLYLLPRLPGAPAVTIANRGRLRIRG